MKNKIIKEKFYKNQKINIIEKLIQKPIPSILELWKTVSLSF